MTEKNSSILSPEYLNFKNEITARIRSAQYEALKAVNKEMIALYWEVGKRITEQQTALGWGKSVVENLSRDIQKEFPGIKILVNKLLDLFQKGPFFHYSGSTPDYFTLFEND